MGMRMVGPLNSGAAAGGNGVATANADNTGRITGRLYGVYVKYNAACPGSTTVTLTSKGDGAPALTLLAVPAGNTSGWYFPRVQIHTTAAAAIAAQYDRLPVDDKVNVKIDLANALCNADVWLLLDD